VAAGVAYVYISGRSETKNQASEAPATTQDSSPLPKPVPPGPNAPEGVAVAALTSPVKIGSNASLTVLTNAGSKCSLTVTYNGTLSTDSGLVPKTADAYGNVSWTWTITSSVPAGSWPIKVTCVYNGRSAVVQADQVVTK
jgi:hypothetical protein